MPIFGNYYAKFRISSTNEHKIDYSSIVGGLWLDKGEWDLLKNEGLAGCLNAVVTQHWQNKIKQNSAKDNISEIYLAKSGEGTYSKIKELREWLENHEQKSDLRAYILAEDPYSAER